MLFDGQDVTARDTGARNMAQVFQVPVIYRSMTVGENLAFPLICRRVPQAAINRRVADIAEMLGLSAKLKTPANKLTSDQKQLISLGRGLVRDDVSAILLDEPLRLIDPQMKFELRRILKQINAATRLTMVLVTHDQNEAMTFARTIVVMNHGRVVQSGDPQTLFERPATDYVGHFIGSPPMNFLPARLDGGLARVPGLGLSAPAPAGLADEALTLGFRPEHVAAGGAGQPLAGIVTRLWFEGLDQVAEVQSGEQRFRARLSDGAVQAGAAITLRLPEDRIRLYQHGRLVA